jgi:hypothetical protein
LTFFARLREAGLRLDGFIANRVLMSPTLVGPALHREIDNQPRVTKWSPIEHAAALGSLDVAVNFLDRAARAQGRELQRLAARAPGVPIAKLPLLAHEASSLTALRTIGDYLAGA